MHQSAMQHELLVGVTAARVPLVGFHAAVLGLRACTDSVRHPEERLPAAAYLGTWKRAPSVYVRVPKSVSVTALPLAMAERIHAAAAAAPCCPPLRGPTGLPTLPSDRATTCLSCITMPDTCAKCFS